MLVQLFLRYWWAVSIPLSLIFAAWSVWWTWRGFRRVHGRVNDLWEALAWVQEQTLLPEDRKDTLRDLQVPE